MRENFKIMQESHTHTLSTGVTTVTSVTNPKPEPELKPRAQTQVTCPKCGTTGGAFDMRIHLQKCEGTD